MPFDEFACNREDRYRSIKPDGSELFVPLGIGVILPNFHLAGKMSLEIERLNSLHIE